MLKASRFFCIRSSTNCLRPVGKSPIEPIFGVKFSRSAIFSRFDWKLDTISLSVSVSATNWIAVHLVSNFMACKVQTGCFFENATFLFVLFVIRTLINSVFL